MYLLDTKRGFKYNNILSNFQVLKIGAPQDTIIRPILFIMQINSRSLMRITGPNWTNVKETIQALIKHMDKRDKISISLYSFQILRQLYLLSYCKIVRTNK